MENDFKMSSEDVKKARLILEELHGVRIKNIVNYGDDEEKFNDSVDDLIQYIHQLIESESCHIMFLKRIQAGVYYGECESGIDINKGVINLNNMDGLKIIFDSINDEFKGQLSVNDNDNSFSLFTIRDNLVLKVDSQEVYDLIWLSQYVEDKKEKVKKR